LQVSAWLHGAARAPVAGTVESMRAMDNGQQLRLIQDRLVGGVT
jgi:hypothetical protein